MKRLLPVVLPIAMTLTVTSCTNIGGASKSSTSLGSFLGVSELPDWYLTHRYLYKDSQWLENDFGLPIHYRDVGKGPVLVLVHGEISSMQTWDKWVDTLAQDFRVITLDLPGAGLTGAPLCVSDPLETCPENLNEVYLKHTLEYFIDDLKLPQFTLVGSSYAGYLAAQYALEHPAKLEKLVLIAPMGMQQDVPWIVNYLTVPGMDIFSSYVQPSTVISTIVDDFYGASTNLKQVTLERYLHLAQSEGAHAAIVRQIKLLRKLMEGGMALKIEDIRIPTLIMWGQQDTWGKFEHATRWQEAIKDSLLVKYTELGHVPMEEFPEQSVADIIAYMNGEPLPTIEGLGVGGTFTIKDAEKEFDKDALFGAPKAEPEPQPEGHDHGGASKPEPAEPETAPEEPAVPSSETSDTEMDDLL